jgi:hypothetical protein
VPPVADVSNLISMPTQRLGERRSTRSRRDSPLARLAMLLVLRALVQVRVPRETFSTVALVDLFRGNTALLPFVHVPADRAVDVTGLQGDERRMKDQHAVPMQRARSKRITEKEGTHGRLGLFTTANGLSLSADVSEERSSGTTIVSFLLRGFRVSTTPVYGLMEFAPGGGDRGSSEEGDGDKCFDRGHLVVIRL